MVFNGAGATRLMRAAAVAMLVVLAGCSSATGPATDAPISIADEYQATDDTGIVLGVVVDEAIRPLSGVNISIATDPVLHTQTNKDGEFGLDGIPGGTYLLEAQHSRFLPAKVMVTVEAGVQRPDLLKLVLTVDTANVPALEEFQFNGFLQCGVNYVAVCGIGPFVGTLLCTQYDVCVGNITNDRFIAFHEIRGPPDWVQAEMVWQSTQSLSNELTLIQSYADRDQFNEGFIEGNLNRSTGPSPIYITVNGTVAQNESVALGTERHLVPRVFSGSIPASRQCAGNVCVSFGFTLEQRFTIYTHVFHAYVPPPGWRFTEDGAAPP